MEQEVAGAGAEAEFIAGNGETRQIRPLKNGADRAVSRGEGENGMVAKDQKPAT